MKANRLIRKIQKAEEANVDAILGAALARKMELCPEWEIVYMAVSRDTKQKWQKTVRAVLEVLAVEDKDG